MSISEAWDRFFWSIMLVIFVGLLWMKFLQPYAACEGPGAIVALLAGGIYFYLGYRSAHAAESEDAHPSESASGMAGTGPPDVNSER